MKALTLLFVLSAVCTPSTALAMLQAAPMTEPTPVAVVQAAGRVRMDRTARAPAMGKSTHAIMMPGADMPMPGQSRATDQASSRARATPHR